MLESARKILIVALLLVMPLQAVAASVSHIACTGGAAANAHANDGHHHDASGEDNAPDYRNTDTGGGQVDNLSCYQPATAGSRAAIAVVVEFGSGFAPVESSVPGHFFPEQPQRVPLA